MTYLFRRIECLSDGDVYRVYRGRPTEDPLATRILKETKPGMESPGRIAMLKAEFEVLRYLDDVEGVVRPVSCGRIDGRWALVFEDIGGRDLQSLLPTTLDLSMDDKLSVAIRAGEALARVHARNVLHKSISPRSIVCNLDSGEVNLIQFGQASRLTRERVTGKEELVGDLCYIAPEQTGRMNRTVDHRSDLYAFGGALYYWLTGCPPFEEPDALALVHAHIAKVPTAAHKVVKSIPLAVSAIVSKLLEKNAELRYQSATGVVHDLRTCQEQLRAHGRIESFELAQRDGSAAFHIPQKLYGRSGEVDEVVRRFQAACDAQTQVMLVSGYSGVGKTALVHEVQEPMAAACGHFIEGKFEQLTRNQPYSAIIQAFRSLAEIILAGDKARFAMWKRRILEATRPNTRVITDVIPEVELIVGPQPPVAELNTAENANRFRRTFLRCIRAFIDEEFPLTVFVDDLQWADPASLDVLKHLAADPAQPLMIIGAYRENEVSELHPLVSWISEMKSGQTSVCEIALRPLPYEEIQRLLRDMLGCTLVECAPLAEICKARTDGNPFFLTTFLEHLHAEGVLRFDAGEARWTWDEESIERIEASSNVVDLLVGRLSALPEKERQLLTTAACVGNVFDARVLARILGRGTGEVLREIAGLIEGRFLIHLNAAYRLLRFQEEEEIEREQEANLSFKFLHDRVQQAAAALISAADRQRLSQEIGMQLLERYRDAPESVSIFAVVDQLNAARSVIHPVVRTELAQLNLEAARGAMRSVAYDSAVTYLRVGIELIGGAAGWADAYSLMYDLSYALMQAEDLAGRNAESEAVASELIDRARTVHDQCHVYALVVAQRVRWFKIQDALSTGLRALALLGFVVPERPTDKEVRRAADAVATAMQGRAIADNLDLPRVRDPLAVATHEVINSMYGAAYIGNLALLRLLSYIGTRLSIERGNHPASATHFAYYAMLRSEEGLRDGLEWGELANALNERDGTGRLRCKILCLQGAMINHPFESLRSTLRLIRESVEYGKNYGDYNYVTYAHLHGLNAMWLMGLNLEELRREAEDALRFAEQVEMAEVSFRMQLAFGDSLAGEGVELGSLNGKWFSEDEFLEVYADQPYVAYDFHVKKAFLLHLAGRRGEAYTQAKMCAAGIAGALFASNVSIYARFVYGLTIAGYLPHASGRQRPGLIKELRGELALVTGSAERCQENYLHAQQLLEAEVAAAEGESTEEVLRRFDEAIQTADYYQQAHHAAMAAESALRFARRTGEVARGATYFELARAFYGRWGADGKITQLEAEYRDLNQVGEKAAIPNSATDTSDLSSSLDLRSMMKASQSLSNEVRLEVLLRQVMTILAENAGAQRGYLLLVDGTTGDLRIQSQVVEAGVVEGVLADRALESDPDLPSSIVRYCARSLKPVVLGEATSERRFQQDEAILRRRPLSVLALPIVKRNALVGVLYFENNFVTHAFSGERVELLQVLATQAAISIENARLYRTLELKVEERTAQLAEKTRNIQVMLQNLRLGIFTILEDGTVHPEYSAQLEDILGERELAGRDAFALLTKGSDLGQDTRSRLQSAFSVLLGEDEVNYRLNEDQLVSEMTRAVGTESRRLEIDWDPIYCDGVVEKLLVTLRDVTKIRALEVEAKQQRAELDMLGEILSIPSDSFSQFIRSSNQFIRENRQLLEAFRSNPREPEKTIERLFRNMHTIKGNARLFRLRQLVDSVHLAEQTYQGARTAPDEELNVSRMLLELDSVDAVLNRYAGLYEAKIERNLASPDRRAVEFAEAIVRDVSALSSSTRFADPQANLRFLRLLQDRIDALNRYGLNEILADAIQRAPELSRSLGKVPPIIEVRDEGVALDEGIRPLLANVFGHCLRNSLDHGLEPASQRLAAGKDPRGLIILEASRGREQVEFRIYDDGRGLDLRVLRQKGLERGWFAADPPPSDQEVAQVIFRSGSTTAVEVSDLSGRGVGLESVRAFIREQGGDVNVRFRGPEQPSGRRAFELVLTLPVAAGVPHPQSGQLQATKV